MGISKKKKFFWLEPPPTPGGGRLRSLANNVINTHCFIYFIFDIGKGETYLRVSNLSAVTV